VNCYLKLWSTVISLHIQTQLSQNVEIMLKLKISISNIDGNCIATAPKLCLPVKHSMFHRQTKSQCSGNTIEWDIQRWNSEFENEWKPSQVYKQSTISPFYRLTNWRQLKTRVWHNKQHLHHHHHLNHKDHILLVIRRLNVLQT